MSNAIRSILRKFGKSNFGNLTEKGLSSLLQWISTSDPANLIYIFNQEQKKNCKNQNFDL